ncbi:MAG TPA: hypothetical protein VFZ24_05450 [Longimicrobiales bacterium]
MKNRAAAPSPSLARSALLLAAFLASGCSDPSGPPRPAQAVPASAVLQEVPAGTTVPVPPAVRVLSRSGRPVSGVRVDFSVMSGGGNITDAQQVTGADGAARLGSWVLGTAPGSNTVRATIHDLPGVEVVFEAIALPDGCSGLVTLDHAAGDFVRLKGSTFAAFPCLLFDPARSAGHDYLLLLENLSPTGPFAAALFPGAAADTTFAFTVTVEPLAATGPVAARARMVTAEEDARYTWDFGAGRIHEHIPPAGTRVPEPMLLRPEGAVALNSAAANAVVGDTIEVVMEGLPRLGIPTGHQKAVVRFVSDELIIAEDVRLTTTLVRETGGFNTPLSDADLTAIATEYAAVARIQGDLLFDNRHNLAVEAGTPPRIVAIHSLMPRDSVWGYTYSISDYLVWDFWVATDGSTKGLNQHPQRVADNIFMHEIAHMRHMGLLQHNGLGLSQRGNRWLVEGFARFTERLPIAARLLGTATPARTGNVVLPRNPAFNNAYFMDDVPTYLHAGSSMYFGYHASAFVFDYFADRVALGGGDWIIALREFLLAGASATTLDAVVQKWLPGTSFLDLFTRARVALYTDDIGTAGLPDWTQYHQYRLRESRPAPQSVADQDPRVQWPLLSPAAPAVLSGAVAAGAATGFLVAGSTGDPISILRVSGTAGAHTNLSLTRIR